jgi:anti-sigma factor RsiW
MNELKLQAYFDGELPEREGREVAEWLARDQSAQALLSELKATSTVLRENEPEVVLPESREFYWSKIERAIEAAESAPAERVDVPLIARLRKFLAPFAGVALVLFLGILSLKVNTPAPDPFVQHLAEVESLNESVSSFSFRSQSENMFVVWLSEKSDHAKVDPSDPEGMPMPMPMPMPEDDMILQ